MGAQTEFKDIFLKFCNVFLSFLMKFENQLTGTIWKLITAATQLQVYFTRCLDISELFPPALGLEK